jgi:hypothetical protein
MLLLFAVPPLLLSLSAHTSPRVADWTQKRITFKGGLIRFEEVIGRLSEQMGQGIAVDGEPLLDEAEITFEGTAREALDYVADRFDYTWAVNRHGVILLHKHFRNWADYPRLNSAEMRQMARDVLRVLYALPYERTGQGYTLYLNELYRSFTPQQKAVLRAGKSLSFRELTLQQGELLYQSLLSGYFGEMCQDWNMLLRLLDMLPSSYLVLRQGRQIEGKIVYGSDIAVKPSGEQEESLELVCVLRDRRSRYEAAQHLLEIIQPPRR